MNEKMIRELSENIENIDLSRIEINEENVYEYAQYIVEPTFKDNKVLNNYYDFMDNDIDNWVTWIRNNFGEQWG